MSAVETRSELRDSRRPHGRRSGRGRTGGRTGGRAAGRGSARRPTGSGACQHSTDSCSGSPGCRGGCRRFAAIIRAHASGAVHSLELDGAQDLPPVRVRFKSNREDAGFHLKRGRNVGTAAAAGIDTGNRDASVRVDSTVVPNSGNVSRQAAEAPPAPAACLVSEPSFLFID